MQINIIFSHKINGILPLNFTLVAPVTLFYSLTLLEITVPKEGFFRNDIEEPFLFPQRTFE